MEIKHAAVAIIATCDLDASQAFYERLGFALTADYPHNGYRILHDPHGASLHLTFVGSEWVQPDRNPNGIYLYSQEVERLATATGAVAERKPWGIREFALTDPSGTQVRIGWPDPA